MYKDKINQEQDKMNESELKDKNSAIKLNKC